MVRKLITTCVLYLIILSVNSQTCSLEIASGFLYSNCENLFVVHVNSDHEGKIQTSIDNGTIKLSNSNGDSAYWYIATPKSGIYATISVFEISGKDSILLAKERYRVRPLPLPWAKLATQSCKFCMLDVRTLKYSFGLQAPLVNVGFEIAYPIVSYRVIALRDSSMIFAEEISGCDFTESLLKQFDLLQSGDQVIFTSIKARISEGYEEVLNSIEVQIK